MDNGMEGPITASIVRQGVLQGVGMIQRRGVFRSPGPTNVEIVDLICEQIADKAWYAANTS